MSHLPHSLQLVLGRKNSEYRSFCRIMVTAQKSPELEAQEDLQKAISEHKLAIQTALRRSALNELLPAQAPVSCILLSSLYSAW